MVAETVGYLGPEGSWSQEASMRFRPEGMLKPYLSICRIVEAVEKNEIKYGTLPMENTTGGGIGETLDCLFFSKDVVIEKEVIMPISHALMSSGSFDQINTVVSHPNALSQCRSSIAAILPGAAIRASVSTAEAAKEASHDQSIAALGSLKLSEIYHLTVHRKGISDEKRSLTRFVFVGKTNSPETKKDKTTVCLSEPVKGSGALWDALGFLSSLGIEVTRIEPRPVPGQPGHYRYFLDFLGHSEDLRVKTALKGIASSGRSLKILGSYPMEPWPY